MEFCENLSCLVYILVETARDENESVNCTSLWAKIKFVGVPQSENCIPLTDSGPLMGEKCPFMGSIVPFRKIPSVKSTPSMVHMIPLNGITKVD